jgi:hypothetical protein
MRRRNRIAEAVLGALISATGWSPPPPKHHGTVPANPPSAALSTSVARVASGGMPPGDEAEWMNTLTDIRTLPSRVPVRTLDWGSHA